MARRQPTEHEQRCLDILEASGVKITPLPAPGSFRRRPSKNDLLYPLWLKQKQEQKAKNSSVVPDRTQP